MFPKGAIDVPQARSVINRIMTIGANEPNGAAIRGFLDPNLKVAEMVKAGTPAGEINKYIDGFQRGFTRGGGFTGFTQRVGAFVEGLGRTMIIGVPLFAFHVYVDGVDAQRMRRAGKEFVPVPGYEAAYHKGLGVRAPGPA